MVLGTAACPSAPTAGGSATASSGCRWSARGQPARRPVQPLHLPRVHSAALPGLRLTNRDALARGCEQVSASTVSRRGHRGAGHLRLGGRSALPPACCEDRHDQARWPLREFALACCCPDWRAIQICLIRCFTCSCAALGHLGHEQKLALYCVGRRSRSWHRIRCCI